MKQSWICDNCVSLFLYDEHDTEDLPQDWQSLTAPEEQTRAAKMGSKARAYTFLRTRALLRKELAKYLDADPARLKIDHTPEGKPFLVETKGLFPFSLSHSHGKILIGLMTAHGGVGVDLEYQDPSTPIEKLAERFFTPDEYLEITNVADEAGRRQAFFRAWCLKEAQFKLGGAERHSIRTATGTLGGGFSYAICYAYPNTETVGFVS